MSLIPQPSGNTPWVQSSGVPSLIFLQYMLALDIIVRSTTLSWSGYTPVVTPNTGSLTTVSASGRYLQIGKSVLLQATVTITTNGTGAGWINVSLPLLTANAGMIATFHGRESAVSGKMLQGSAAANSNTMNVFNYDNTYPGASGAVLALSGVYETS